MNKQTKALKMAIEALESAYGVLECEGMIPIGYESAIQVCKEALEQEQSFAEKTAQMSFMSLWDAYTTLKMKLEALEQPASKNIRESFNEMLEDKVAYYKGKQPAQEPVAWMEIKENAGYKEIKVWQEPVSKQSIPLYPHPAPSWQGLSNNKITSLFAFYGADTEEAMIDFARAIEQALRNKNGY